MMKEKLVSTDSGVLGKPRKFRKRCKTIPVHFPPLALLVTREKHGHTLVGSNINDVNGGH